MRASEFMGQRSGKAGSGLSLNALIALADQAQAEWDEHERVVVAGVGICKLIEGKAVLSHDQVQAFRELHSD